MSAYIFNTILKNVNEEIAKRILNEYFKKEKNDEANYMFLKKHEINNLIKFSKNNLLFPFSYNYNDKYYIFTDGKINYTKPLETEIINETKKIYSKENKYFDEKLEREKFHRILIALDKKQDTNFDNTFVYLGQTEIKINIYEIAGNFSTMIDKDEYLQKIKYLYKYKRLVLEDPCSRTNNKLPKYVLNENTKDAIEKSTIFLSYRKQLNDPFECSVGRIDEMVKYNKFKIFATSRKYDDILMWPYYGDSHSGVCLKYKFEDIFNNLSNLVQNNESRKLFVGDVIYENKRLTDDVLQIYKNELEKDSFELIWNLFVSFTKSNHWEHEKEFRFVVVGDESEEGILVKNVPIVGLYVGYNANENLLRDIDNDIIRNGKYIKMKPDESSYKIVEDK